jgi:hypothetical protein
MMESFPQVLIYALIKLQIYLVVSGMCHEGWWLGFINPFWVVRGHRAWASPRVGKLHSDQCWPLLLGLG